MLYDHVINIWHVVILQANLNEQQHQLLRQLQQQYIHQQQHQQQMAKLQQQQLVLAAGQPPSVNIPSNQSSPFPSPSVSNGPSPGPGHSPHGPGYPGYPMPNGPHTTSVPYQVSIPQSSHIPVNAAAAAGINVTTQGATSTTSTQGLTGPLQQFLTSTQSPSATAANALPGSSGTTGDGEPSLQKDLQNTLSDHELTALLSRKDIATSLAEDLLAQFAQQQSTQQADNKDSATADTHSSPSRDSLPNGCTGAESASKVETEGEKWSKELKVNTMLSNKQAPEKGSPTLTINMNAGQIITACKGIGKCLTKQQSSLFFLFISDAGKNS